LEFRVGEKMQVADNAMKLEKTGWERACHTTRRNEETAHQYPLMIFL
jgi:hypothetical protein